MSLPPPVVGGAITRQVTVIYFAFHVENHAIENTKPRPFLRSGLLLCLYGRMGLCSALHQPILCKSWLEWYTDRDRQLAQCDGGPCGFSHCGNRDQETSPSTPDPSALARARCTGIFPVGTADSIGCDPCHHL